MSMDLRTARAYLMLVAGTPAPNLQKLVSEAGPAIAATAILEGRVPVNIRAEITDNVPRHCAEEALNSAARLGHRLIVPEDDEWPVERLAGLANPPSHPHSTHTLSMPFGLWVRGHGRLDDLVARSAAVIGARAATPYGERLSTNLGYDLATNDISVVSGAAYGIDAAALRGVLSARGRTVVVLACGVDIAYPVGHASLLQQVAEHGLIVSEYAPRTTPSRARFLVRNRLVAALGGITAVVEARERGGTRHTAAIASRLNRTVFAFPGPVTSVQSGGTHALIRDGIARLADGSSAVVTAAQAAATDPGDATEPTETDGSTAAGNQTT